MEEMKSYSIIKNLKRTIEKTHNSGLVMRQQTMAHGEGLEEEAVHYGIF